jgi:membrane-bound serine protease (ClpP class)
VRRLAIALVGLTASATIALGGLLAGGASPAAAQATTVVPAPTSARTAGSATATAPVRVVQASGLLDAVLVHEIEQAIATAERTGAQALIIQLNSKGAVVGRDAVAALAGRIHDAKVPVAIWVGPAGSRAVGLSGQLLGAAAATGIAPGSRVGHFGEPLTLPGGGALQLGAGADALRTKTTGALDARNLGLVRNALSQDTVPVLRSMVDALNGLEWQGRTVATTEKVPAADGTIQTRLTSPLVLGKLGLVAQLMHTVSSPPVAYLLLVIGLGLLLFEFFTAGVGVAGVVGAVALVLACYGFGALPVRGLVLGLLIASFAAFAVDVQTGVPRFWTAVGVGLFVVASVFLYRGLSLSWVPLAAGIGGVLLTFLSGMPSMVRTRFATPTIGREWMIGAMGEAVTWVDPEGIVQVGEGKWRARTNRATPIGAGGRLRVVAIDGVTLEVEPEEGAARDHRERRATPTPTDA